MTGFERSRKALSDGQTFGVWSLIVTFFGDMAQGPEDKVSGAVLTALGTKLEIRPEAMRVALHRLRKDGWIESERAGRGSLYVLTEPSRTESARASDQIYSRFAPRYSGVHVLVPESTQRSNAVSKGWIPIGQEVAIRFDGVCDPVGTSLMTHFTGPIPQWITKTIISDDLLHDYQQFLARLERIQVETLGALSPTEIAALRVLLVHGWRRLILKHPKIPDEAFPTACPAADCRAKVFQILDKMPRPDLAKLVESV